MQSTITLYAGDAEQFEAIKQRIAEARNGNEPSNAEVVRLLMQEAEAGGGVGGIPR